MLSDGKAVNWQIKQKRIYLGIFNKLLMLMCASDMTLGSQEQPISPRAKSSDPEPQRFSGCGSSTQLVVIAVN